MGIFTFMKNAGAKLVGADDESRSIKLTEQIAGSGLSVEDLKVVINGEKATVSGTAAKQSIKEKIILMVGNNDGIESVEDKMTVKQQPEEVVAEEEAEPVAQFYTVEKGDTLGGIAKKFYGQAGKYPVIFEANKPMLKNPDLIYPGQSLRIPEL
ncbi:MAG: peptidoglycan-binding protein LysM [Bacteroidales bacterium]|nr:peptidoglycan-binding protein LysM [Bacteroidales bacterium]